MSVRPSDFGGERHPHNMHGERSEAGDEREQTGAGDPVRKRARMIEANGEQEQHETTEHRRHRRTEGAAGSQRAGVVLDCRRPMVRHRWRFEKMLAHFARPELAVLGPAGAVVKPLSEVAERVLPPAHRGVLWRVIPTQRSWQE